MTAAELTARLAAFLAKQVGAAVEIDNLRRVPGGASRETWSFDACYQNDGVPVRRALILRRDPGAHAVQTSRREEFVLLQAAHACGVPVPQVFWLGDETESLAARFFIMERVEGETLARRLLRDEPYATARRVMTAQLGAILARIHQIDIAAPQLDFLPRPQPGESPAQAELERYEQIFRGLAPDPHPAFELAFRWLQQRLPAAARQTLVHGDYRIGNVIFGPEGTRSILDWELAHIGDPMEDLGWMCVRSWRFGSDDKPVGGIGQREEFFAAYDRAGGGAVDPERVRFWEVFGNLKWATITITQARTYLDGGVRSVELASLGRRTAEMELELLDLIEAP
ncbi:MAG: phosphotransferase family protein [Deltaproteobacteria bacterium]|nr:phosphotransferase family protein [Deltaproteobacteria bacterium]